VQITSRQAAAEDEDFLQVLFASAHPELSMLPLAPEQLKQLLIMQWAAQQKDYRESFPESEHSIILIDGRPAGRIWVSRNDREIHVLDISVLPEFRRAGVGGFVYRQLIEEGEATARSVRCSVFRYNDVSFQFHQRMGFKVTSETDLFRSMEWFPTAQALAHDSASATS
jgi:GNAT superfamily N-acetyltransferase